LPGRPDAIVGGAAWGKNRIPTDNRGALALAGAEC
jgi:hypothetical protein